MFVVRCLLLLGHLLMQKRGNSERSQSLERGKGGGGGGESFAKLLRSCHADVNPFVSGIDVSDHYIPVNPLDLVCNRNLNTPESRQSNVQLSSTKMPVASVARSALALIVIDPDTNNNNNNNATT